jgi:stage II sporulation protein M
MLEWYRRLPARVRGWVPYVGGAALAMGLVGILGFGVGAASPPATSLPIRGPDPPPPSAGIWTVFAHNAGIALGAAAGVLTFGVYTTWVVLVNGFTIGAVAADAVEANGWAWAALGLLPHGVVELPAFWLAGAVGFRWLAFVRTVARGDRDRIGGPWLVLESLAVVGFALALLLVAAVVEVLVTFRLA